MIKRGRIFWVMIIVCLLILSISGCQHKAEKATFSATVMRVDESAVLVRPSQGASELKSADLISVGLSNTEITDAKGEILPISSLVVGLRVDITYGGDMALSYPAQIHDCTKLTAYVDTAKMPNPMVAFDTPDFNFIAGFALTGIPDALHMDGIWLISGRVAQLDLSTLDGVEGMLRCAKATGEDISGLHGVQFEREITKAYDDILAQIFFTDDKKALAHWQRGGYDFVLWFPEVDTERFLKIASAVISGVKATEDF